MSTPATLAGAAAAAGALAWVLHVRKTARPQRGAPAGEASSARLFALGKRVVLSRLLDVGGFFGVDIGGSLTKLVFFMPDADMEPRVLRKAAPSDAASWHAKLASIKKIHAFVMSTDTYGRTGVRDSRLAFHMPEFGGTFHFIRCVGSCGDGGCSHTRCR
jgi:hypothetical protein